MMPAVEAPAGKVRTPVDVKLKQGWRFDTSRRVFVSDKGREFAPRGELPRTTRIVYKAPALASARKGLTKDEQNLVRYMQVILPAGERAADYVEAIGRWPCVAAASLPPQLSLPKP
jgi:hypothetical protein